MFERQIDRNWETERQKDTDIGARKGRGVDTCVARGQEEMNAGEIEAKLENKYLKAWKTIIAKEHDLWVIE